MKKIYQSPAVEINETQVCQMMAVSLPINDTTTVDGSQALSKENDDINIWED